MTDKERLEEIKIVTGLDYLIGGTKLEKHWDWLIKQAEKTVNTADSESYVVLSKDSYLDIQVVCICKDIEVARIIVKERNEKHKNYFSWFQVGETV